MAEDFSEAFASFIHTAGRIYMVLQDAYKALPIPIVIPADAEIDGGIEQIHEVLLDAADRLADLPVDEVAGQLLVQATYHWATATAVMRLYVSFRNDSYSELVKWNFIQAFEEADLALGMLRFQD